MCEPMALLYFVFVQSVLVFVGRPSPWRVRVRAPEQNERDAQAHIRAELVLAAGPGYGCAN
jgi:hypothetical protein